MFLRSSHSLCAPLSAPLQSSQGRLEALRMPWAPQQFLWWGHETRSSTKCNRELTTDAAYL